MSKHHGLKELPGLGAYCTGDDHAEQREDRFGRMFPDLPPNYAAGDLLVQLGRAGGPMDGGTSSTRTNSVPVGHVMFGQFIDHDITLDVTSSLSRNQHASDTPNVRTPTLDLDCIYGDGPEAHPYLYDDGVKLLTGADSNGATVEQSNDLLRSPNGRAMIGDPRNDENRIVSQLQLGIIRFHNAMCDTIAAEPEGHTGGELFEEARHRVTWHYQWAVVFDFLGAMCGRPVVDDILANGRRIYCMTDRPFIPVEFSVAAYRFGHSMVPMKIQVQKGGALFEFFGGVLGRGFTAVSDTRAIVDWHELFDTSAGRTVQRADRLDTSMASDLLDLPFVDDLSESSLATRNLLRGNVFRLPSGEQVARQLEIDAAEVRPVTDLVRSLADQGVAGNDVAPLTTGSPLWLYILAEAEVIGRAKPGGTTEPGEGLGPVGARIVAEVLIGLLEMDERSFLGANRNWVPDPAFGTIGEILASTNWDGLPT